MGVVDVGGSYQGNPALLREPGDLLVQEYRSEVVVERLNLEVVAIAVDPLEPLDEFQRFFASL